MKAVMISVAFLFCFVSQSLCGSVRLMNDSPFKLKAVVLAADGTNLGEKVLAPQESIDFNDSLGGANPTDYSLGAPSPNPSGSLTPYTVFWYCMDGTSYSHCQNVSAGAYVTPSQCQGNQYCRIPKNKEQQQPQNDQYQGD